MPLATWSCQVSLQPLKRTLHKVSGIVSFKAANCKCEIVSILTVQLGGLSDVHDHPSSPAPESTASGASLTTTTPPVRSSEPNMRFSPVPRRLSGEATGNSKLSGIPAASEKDNTCLPETNHNSDRLKSPVLSENTHQSHLNMLLQTMVSSYKPYFNGKTVFCCYHSLTHILKSDNIKSEVLQIFKKWPNLNIDFQAHYFD